MQISSTGGGNAAVMMQQMREKMFAQADSDQSGGLSLDEFKAMGPSRGPSPGGRPPGGPPPGGGPGAAASAGGTAKAAGTSATASAEDVFNSLDTDGDGTVSQGELAAGEERRSQGAISGEGMSALLSAQEQSSEGFASRSPAEVEQAIERMIRHFTASGDAQRSGASTVTA